MEVKLIVLPDKPEAGQRISVSFDNIITRGIRPETYVFKDADYLRGPGGRFRTADNVYEHIANVHSRTMRKAHEQRRVVVTAQQGYGTYVLENLQLELQ